MKSTIITIIAVLSLYACSRSSYSARNLEPWYDILKECKEHYFRMELDSSALKCALVEEFCINNELEQGVPALHAEVENFKGALSQEMNNREESAQHYRNAYRFEMSTDKRLNVVRYCINLADVLRQMGRAPEAAQWLQRAVSLADSLNLHDMDCAVMTQLGQVYTDIGNYHQSDKYFLKAEEICPAGTVDEIFLANARCNSYYTRQEYPQALEQSRRVARIAKETDDRMNQKIAEINLGDLYLAMDNLDSAQVYINSSMEFWNSTPGIDDAILFYVNALKAGLLIKQGHTGSAMQMLNKKYDRSRIGPIYLNFYNRLMMNLSTKTGDWKSAYEYGRKLYSYKDSLFKNTLEMNFSEAEARFRRDTTLLHQQIRLERQSRTISKLHTGLMGLAVLAVFAAMIFHIRRKRMKLRYIEELSMLRLENLRKLISPHSIFNAIYATHMESSILMPLMRILRSSVDYAGQIGISLEKEIQNANDIALLRKSLGSNNISFETTVDAEVDVNHLVPISSVSLFVENAYKHAFANGTDNGAVHVHIGCTNEVIHIEVSDNGCGFCTDGTSGRNEAFACSGTGLRNFRHTLDILNTFNEHKASMEIRSSSSGTTVKVSIPNNYRMHI